MYKSRGKRGRRNSIGLGKFVIGGNNTFSIVVTVYANIGRKQKR